MPTANEYTNMMKSREKIYLFLSRIFEKELTSDIILQLQNTQFPSDCGSEIDQGYSLINKYFMTANVDIEEELAVDYAKVFLAAGKSKGKAAFPYESVYTSTDKMVMQEAWEQVKNIYAAKGLGLKTELADIKEDHIAVELHYMEYLCKEFQAGSAGICLEEQREFLQNHLLNWVPSFCEDVQKYSDTDFYKGAAGLIAAILNQDLQLLEELISDSSQDPDSYTVDLKTMDSIMTKLKQEYKIYAPKLMQKRGSEGQDIVRYGVIDSISEIVYDRKSDFSPKEVYYPVIQTMLHFTDETCTETKLKDDKPILIFVRPCDINAMGRLDNIFNVNGGHADIYYKRMRDKVKIVMLECKESFKNCFCVSMGANKTEDYSMAVHIGDQCEIQVKDSAFKSYFANQSKCDFKPEFVSSNEDKAVLPVIDDKETLKIAAGLEFWNKFNDKCIACGGCNTVCPTCSCFDTVDIIYDETSREGERRRVWSSCMLNSFTLTAGGNRARATNGASMRFKTLHKVYDYRERFKTAGNMCIGCGRCISQCPEEISFLETINEFHDELEKAKNTAGGQ